MLSKFSVDNAVISYVYKQDSQRNAYKSPIIAAKTQVKTDLNQ